MPSLFQTLREGGRKTTFFAVVLVAASFGSANAQQISKYLKKPDDWFKSTEARQIATNVLSYQSDWGGWLKNTDTVDKPYTGDRLNVQPTFDNKATTGEMRFLARMYDATGDEKYRAAFERGLDYILVAQHPTGGWPQSYPADELYHRYITFNDGAMERLLRFLREVYSSDTFAFLSKERRAAAHSAYDRGIACILKCQITLNGKLTAWCQQHDEEDYRPRPGRAYELVSLSGAESAGLTRLLMDQETPTPEIVRAVDAAVAWFDRTAIDAATVKKLGSDKKGAPLWARYYEVETNRPIFTDRDSVAKYRLDEIGEERRKGYAWFGGWGTSLLKDYPEWKARGRVPERQAASVEPSYPPALRIGFAGDFSMTDRLGWLFGFKKALTNKALFYDLVGARKGSTPEPRPAAPGRKMPMAEADSPAGVPAKKRPVYGSDEWWKHVIACKPDYLLLQFAKADTPQPAAKKEAFPGEKIKTPTATPEPTAPSDGQIVQMIERARAAGIQPVLVTSLPKVELLADGKVHLEKDPLAGTIRRIANEKRVPLIDMEALAMATLPKADPKSIARLFQAPPKTPGPALSQRAGPLSPLGKEEFGALAAGEFWKAVPNLGRRLGMAAPAISSTLDATTPSKKL